MERARRKGWRRRSRCTPCTTLQLRRGASRCAPPPRPWEEGSCPHLTTPSFPAAQTRQMIVLRLKLLGRLAQRRVRARRREGSPRAQSGVEAVREAELAAEREEERAEREEEEVEESAQAWQMLREAEDYLERCWPRLSPPPD